MSKDSRHIMNQRTFKVKKLTLPQDVFVIELALEEFRKLAVKDDWSPIFENSQGLFHIDFDDRVMFFYAKENQK